MNVWGHSPDVIASMRNWAELSGISIVGKDDDEVVGLVAHQYAGGVTQFWRDVKVWRPTQKFCVIEDNTALNRWCVNERDTGRLLGWVTRYVAEWSSYAAVTPGEPAYLGTFDNPTDAAAEVWLWVSSQDTGRANQ